MSLALAPAILATVTADGLFSKTPGCQTMLGDIAARGHSDLELAAFCHATVPPELCRTAMGNLGQQPWSSAHIAETCRAWEDQYEAKNAALGPARSTQSFPDLQRTVEQCMKVKTDAGLCRGSDTGRPLSLEDCVREKQEKYPKYTQKLTTAMSEFYNIAMTGSAGGQSRFPRPQQMSERLEPAAATHQLDAGLIAGAALVVASAATVGAVAHRRLRRAAGPRHLLVADGQEEATQSDI